ncbi:hypothetical protein HOK68_00965 [Candidatus Woesearchaeota archaeon]|jgi:hypothetical protein|nr:hypothetical protein [Candidatus Woesearchaeota archaeon]MBT4387701.1 hypothetical protein [Candidatus Woesearchaeota archaeon]MBT4595937.1 hypothetical protein [Candidatus Woesearchaeota archaeon]MBT5741067.1 hypothetical protein [Candidatus Woesearchaeota archaeon]MBT6505331.1 hypothetical protein [Candidatus Woesearchaeota archaeon]
MILNKKLFFILFFVLLFQLTQVSSINYETAAVSRIVGDKPEDLINQLENKDLKIDHATYYSDINFKTPQYKYLFDEIFDSNEFYPIYNYNWINTDNLKKNQLFIIETHGDVNKDKVYSSGIINTLKPNEKWVSDFSKAEPLFIFNTDYAGLSIPKKDTYVNKLARYSSIIAPNGNKNKEFNFVLLCSLLDSKNLGELYRDARNKFSTRQYAFQNELNSETLMSYHLYANPLNEYRVSNYNHEVQDSMCNQGFHFGDYEPLSFESLSIKENKINDLVFYDVIIENDGYLDIINISGADYIENPKGSSLPLIISEYEIPKKSNNISVKGDLTFFNNYNLNLLYNETECLNSSKSINYFETLDKYKKIVTVVINPIQTNNCLTKSYSVYNGGEIEINFNPNEDIFITDIQTPDFILPNKKDNVIINFDKYVGNDLGNLSIYENGDIIFTTQLNINDTYLNISIDGKEKESLSEYKIYYEKNNESEIINSFNIYTKLLDINTKLTQINSTDAKIIYDIFNYDNKTIPLFVISKVYHNNDIFHIAQSQMLIRPDFNYIDHNSFKLNYEDNGSYKSEHKFEYGDNIRSGNDILIRNKPPMIKLNNYDETKDYIEVTEGEEYKIDFEIIDDSDNFDFDVSTLHGTFSLETNNYKSDVGRIIPNEYYTDKINITVNDSEFKTSKSLNIKINKFDLITNFNFKEINGNYIPLDNRKNFSFLIFNNIVNLTPGWTLIASDGKLAYQNINESCPNSIVYFYNGDWHKNNFTIPADMGFWILAKDKCQIDLNRYDVRTSNLDRWGPGFSKQKITQQEYNLLTLPEIDEEENTTYAFPDNEYKNGWHLISLNKLIKDGQIDEWGICKNYINKIWIYDKKKWVSILSLEDNYTFDRNVGVWVLCGNKNMNSFTIENPYDFPISFDFHTSVKKTSINGEKTGNFLNYDIYDILDYYYNFYLKQNELIYFADIIKDLKVNESYSEADLIIILSNEDGVPYLTKSGIIK